MEPKLQSTFIPKGAAPHSIGTGLYTNRKETAGTTLLGVIGIIAFLASLIAAVGVFGYEMYLKSSIASMTKNLEAAKQELNFDQIRQIIGFDTRLKATGDILNRHVIISPLFDYLEAATVQSVSFTEFNYKTDQGLVKVELQGLGKSYQSVALQSDVFTGKSTTTPAQSKKTPFKDPIFSDLHLDTKGNVAFTFSATIDPSVISYANFIKSLNLPATPAATTAATSTATTTKAKTQ